MIGIAPSKYKVVELTTGETLFEGTYQECLNYEDDMLTLKEEQIKLYEFDNR